MRFRTKKLIVDVIRIQPGETLPEILETPATAAQVKPDILFNTLLLPIYSTAIFKNLTDTLHNA